MPTFNEEIARIKRELDTIEAVLRTELKKTFIGRWLAKVFLIQGNGHKKKRLPGDNLLH